MFVLQFHFANLCRGGRLNLLAAGHWPGEVDKLRGLKRGAQQIGEHPKVLPVHMIHQSVVYMPDAMEHCC